jgi:hypothetical protein
MFKKFKEETSLTLRDICLPIEESAGHASEILSEWYFFYWFNPWRLNNRKFVSKATS